MTVGIAPQGPDLPVRRGRRRQSGGLCRLQDRPRRHPRRHHGLDRVRRRRGGEAADRAGRRPLHREAADRGLPGADGDRRHRRHPGHGRGRPDQLVGRDGRQGRRRHRAGSRQGAGARDRHDRLRVHAVGKPGAHADGAAARPRGRGARHLRQVGAGLRRHRPPDRYRPHRRAPPGRAGGRHPAGAAERAGAAVSPPDRRDAEAAADQPGQDRGPGRPDRGAVEAGRLPRPLLARLGLGPVRQHRRRPDGEAAGRGRCRRGEAGGSVACAGADHRLHAALLRRRPGGGRRAGGGRGLAQPHRGRCAGRWRSPTT